MKVNWQGVFPAVMTQFKEDGGLDLDATEAHLEAMLEAGVSGFVMLGTMGENGSLEPDEKRAVVRMAAGFAKGRVPILVGIAESVAAAATRLAADCAEIGVDGLMVLPPMIYKSDRAETMAHLRRVAAASDLPIMIYNNPVTYGIDITPDMFAELADEPKFVALKESSDDVRRITDIVNVCGDRYLLFCGVDDIVLESQILGAVGWVAGLVGAFPREAVRMFELVRDGRIEEARAIYRWFMPMLHLDTDVKLVQYIKLAQQMAGYGTEHVRIPRMALSGDERLRVEAIVRQGLETRPNLA
ncbi:MAG: dihydrodipicolinate synthase family protein [Alphaproteobacteria bacterium]|nr:dihydrodipicolinate synthase family protein [Alphaproteobacteria bacterium]